MKQLPCWGSPNIRCCHIKFGTPYDWQPEILSLWSINVTTEKLFHMGTTNLSHLQTHWCVPNHCQVVVGEKVGSCLWSKTPLSWIMLIELQRWGKSIGMCNTVVWGWDKSLRRLLSIKGMKRRMCECMHFQI